MAKRNFLRETQGVRAVQYAVMGLPVSLGRGFKSACPGSSISIFSELATAICQGRYGALFDTIMGFEWASSCGVQLRVTLGRIE